MVPVSELRRRLRNVQRGLDDRGIKALFLGKEEDVYYLSGAESGRIAVTPDDAVLWVKEPYSRLYAGVYGQRRYPLDVRQSGKNCLKDFLKGMRLRRIHVDDISLDYAASMEKSLRKKAAYSSVMEDVRAVKSGYEITRLRKACNMAKACMAKAGRIVREGVRELDAVAELEAEARRLGSCKPPFGTGMLLASGRGSADIHAKATLKRIARGLVVVDLGAVYEGYYSDTTRTFAVKPIREEKELLEFVRDVQREAVDILRPGLACADVYKFVEDRFKKRGFRQYHLPGHGVGLEIHEKPSFSPGSKERLRRNMVFTIEPGIYIPGKMGVRFEDTILLGKKARVLT